MDFDSLISLDKQLTICLNGSDSLFIDALATVLTAATTWIPLYIALFYLVLRNNENIRQVLLVVAGAALCVVLSGTVDDTVIKPLVARWRPTHDPEIGILVDTVDGYRGGNYGFFSAHAANTFSIAMFFCVIVRSRLFSIAMMAWTLLNCWTRLYLGVHYVGDVICGIVWGAVVGGGVAVGCLRIRRKMDGEQNFISSQYTSTGYMYTDIDVVMCVLSLTMVYAAVRACVCAI